MSKGIALRGVDKAALLVAVLGEEAAASVVKTLGPAEVAKLGAALRRIEAVDPILEQAVLRESHGLLSQQVSSVPAGDDLARRILTRAVGAEATDRLLGNSQEEESRRLLRNASPAKLARLLSKEQPQTIAVVLRQIPPRLAAETLALLPDEIRGGALKSLAGSESAAPALVRRISFVLRNHLESESAGGEESELEPPDAGLSHAVAMMRAMGRARGREILASLDKADPGTGSKIRDQLFLFEDLVALPARSLGEVLRGVDAKKLATALKGAEEAVREKFLSALSERAAQTIREEMEYLGGARVQDIEAAQKEIRDSALQLEAAGTINLEDTENVAGS